MMLVVVIVGLLTVGVFSMRYACPANDIANGILRETRRNEELKTLAGSHAGSREGIRRSRPGLDDAA
jgi:hypothetical protein